LKENFKENPDKCKQITGQVLLPALCLVGSNS